MTALPESIQTEIIALLRSVADREQWGYFDDSGCAKGVGSSLESWVGDDEHPQERAERLIVLLQQAQAL